MNCWVVTEQKEDEALLRRVLSTGAPEGSFRLVSAGGYSPAVSLARSVLATSPDRVALVVDAGSSENSQVQRRQRWLEDALSEVAEPGRYLSLVVVPEIEAWYFGTPQLAQATLGHALAEKEYHKLLRHPREELADVLQETSTALASNGKALRLLRRLDPTLFMDLPQVKTLLEFITSRPAATPTVTRG